MSFEAAYAGIDRLDRLSYGDTVVHRLDPRAKVIATMAFAAVATTYAQGSSRWTTVSP